MKIRLCLPILILLCCFDQGTARQFFPARFVDEAGDICDSIDSPTPINEALILNVRLNGGTNTLTISANDSFTLSFDYYITECETPGTFKQIVVGYTALSPGVCVFRSVVDCAGFFESVSVRLKAPNFPDTYTLGYAVTENLYLESCPSAWPEGPPASAQYIGCVTVLAGNSPLPVTGGTVNVTTTGATMQGTVNPNGSPTTAGFLYGTVSGIYPDTVTAVESPLTGVTPVPVTGIISGLSPNVRYYYRLYAENSSGYALGAEKSFFTGPVFTPAVPVHNFGYVDINTERTDSVAIINSGDVALTISSTIPLNGQLSISPVAGMIPPRDTMKFAATFAPLGYGTLNSGIVFIHGGITNPDTQFFEAGVPIGGVSEGWNLVSLPLSVDDPRKNSVFPAAISSAFGFTGGYFSAETLNYGNGYWLKFPAPDSIVMNGDIRIYDTVMVSKGWNMIGCPALPVPLDSISSDPPGIIESSVFEYALGYSSVSMLKPTRGYWVKVSEAGTLYLNSLLAGTVPSNTVGAFPDDRFRRLKVSDSEGRTQTLYIGGEGGGNVEIPPSPPGGGSCYGFEGGYIAVSPGDGGRGEAVLAIRNGSYPLLLSWEPLFPGQRLMVDGASVPVSVGGEVTLKEGMSVRVVFDGRVSRGASSDGAATVIGNYPNPFNPSTVIAFMLAEDGVADLSVFNMVGERVFSFGEEFMTAGLHEVTFDAAALPAGVYVARISTGRRVSSIKMLLLK